MKLSDLEGKLLGALGLRGEATIGELSRLIKTTPHKCRYALESLFAKKLLTRRVLIDIGKLGHSIHALCFSLAPEGRRQRDKIEKSLVEDPQVGYLGESSGRYEYRIDLLSRDSREASRFFSRVCDRFGNVFAERAWSTTLEIWDFPIKRLYSDDRRDPGSRISFEGQQLTVDDRDERILRALCEHDTMSHAAIARILKIPPATFEFRVKQLKERGVVIGYHIVPKAERLRLHGMRTVVYRIRLTKQSSGVRAELEQFARRDPFVYSFTQSIGSYDAEFGTLITDTTEERAFIQRLEKSVGTSLLDIESAEIREHLKVWNFPGE